jgi:hypothetical protein
MPQLQPIVEALDDSIRATIPGLHYAVKWGKPYYGLSELLCLPVQPCAHPESAQSRVSSACGVQRKRRTA